jgi:16S rRNA processing protein RimM
MDLVVGRVGRAHGLTGEVAVEVRTDQPELRFVPGAHLRAGDERVLTIDTLRWHQDRLLIRFEGCEDRSDAENLRGVMLLVDVPDDERPDDPEEFYDHQLVGLAAVTVDGVAFGEVREVLHLPMQDVLAVRSEEGREVLVPFVSDIVPEIDLDGGRVLVDPPEGLLTDEDQPQEAPAHED